MLVDVEPVSKATWWYGLGTMKGRITFHLMLKR